MTDGNLPDLNGILVVNKPGGRTSHDIVSIVRRAVGMKRVGHGGTLDPFATGVLVVAVGRATRVLQYVQDSDKRYIAHVVLGTDTDSYDVEGAVTSRSDARSWPQVTDVEAAIKRFVGSIDQTPPAHSAIKVGGRKLYERARAGEQIELPTRRVEIYSIDLCGYDPPDIFIAVHCSKGTYIRSLARDLGVALDIGAYCHALCRTQTGNFHIQSAWSLDDLSATNVRECWPEVAYHPDAALTSLPAVILDREQSGAWYHGHSVQISTPPPVPDRSTVRAYGEVGSFLGVGSLSIDGKLSPELVFPDTTEGVSQ